MVVPNNHGFIMTWGGPWGYHHLRKHPYTIPMDHLGLKVTCTDLLGVEVWISSGLGSEASWTANSTCLSCHEPGRRFVKKKFLEEDDACYFFWILLKDRCFVFEALQKMIKNIGLHMFFSIKGGACPVMIDKNWSDEEHNLVVDCGQHQ